MHEEQRREELAERVNYVQTLENFCLGPAAVYFPSVGGPSFIYPAEEGALQNERFNQNRTSALCACNCREQKASKITQDAKAESSSSSQLEFNLVARV